MRDGIKKVPVRISAALAAACAALFVLNGCEILSYFDDKDGDGGADYLDGGCGTGRSAVVWASDRSGSNGSLDSRFGIKDTAVLHVSAFTCGVYGEHSAHFALVTPAGEPYTRIGVRFKADGEGTNARRYGGGYILEVEMPVSGSDIRTDRITGIWSARFFLDDDENALGTGFFELYE